MASQYLISQQLLGEFLLPNTVSTTLYDNI